MNTRALPLPCLRQQRLQLEPTPCLPRGVRIRDEPAGLQLVRDGERLGFMASFEVACDYAAALARMETMRQAREEIT